MDLPERLVDITQCHQSWRLQQTDDQRSRGYV